MSVYDRILLSRSPARVTATDFIGRIFTDFTELHGDRRFSDDEAVVAGLAFFEGNPVTVIGLEKGKEVEERIKRNFAQAHPEGYRKAMRLMKQAEKFHRPVVCFVDTAGAFCGIGAEQRGQAQAIAENLFFLSNLKTPVFTVMIGEGGSGGALALAVADKILMLENAYFSVVSPEGCASILWKDSSRAAEAAEKLKLSAEDLLSFGMIDEIIPENAQTYDMIKEKLADFLKNLPPLEKLLENRYEKFRRIGA